MPRLLLPSLMATIIHALLFASDVSWSPHRAAPQVSRQVIRMHLMSRAPLEASSGQPAAKAPSAVSPPATRKTAAAGRLKKPPPQPPVKKRPAQPLALKKSAPQTNQQKAPAPSLSPPPGPIRPKEPPPAPDLQSLGAAGASSQKPVPVALTDTTKAGLTSASPAIPPAGSASFSEKSQDPGAQAATHTRKAVPLYQSNPPPPYPRLARIRGHQGQVILEVLISRAGRVDDLKVHQSSGYPILDRQAVKTVRKWRFQPARQGKHPIAMWVRVPLRFQLHGP